MNNGMVGYVLVFIVLIGAAGIWSNYDTITPTVAQAKADVAIGTGPVQAIEQGASWLLKLFLGATFTGIAVAAFDAARKFYKTWQRDTQLKRWAGGPNAQWRQQSTSSMPRLKREDLMLLALMNGSNRQQPRGNFPAGAMRNASTDDDDLPLEF